MRLTPEQRDHIWQRDHYRCQWPECSNPGAEVAHAHSRGMGGSPSRNDPTNLLLLCSNHARISDGEYGSGGASQYREAHLLLFGPRYLEMPPNIVAWERAEELGRITKIRTKRDGDLSS